MNAYFENTTYSNRLSSAPAITDVRIGDKLISVICAIIAFFTCSVMVKVEKATVATALFFSFFGVIGSIDNGSLGLFGGVALCALIILIEFLTLKSMVDRRYGRPSPFTHRILAPK